MVAQQRGSITGGIFLIGLGIIALMHWWWPGILLVVAITGAAENFLRGRLREAVTTLAVFGVIILVTMVPSLPWGILWALLLIGVGVWLLLSGYLPGRENRL